MRHLISFFAIVFIVSFASFSFYSEFSNGKKPIQVRLIDAEKPADTYTIYWDQTDGSHNTVPQGQYEAELQTENQTLHSHFLISANASHIPVSETKAFFPKNNGEELQLNANTYACGDTVCISFHIQQPQRVKLSIQQADE